MSLAFLGDAVFELMVREYLCRNGNMPAHVLHVKAVRMVCCAAQAKSASLITPLLTEDELAIFKRGRNAHSSTVPKNAKPADYRAATGLETLFGYLYLKGEHERIQTLFDAICTGIIETEQTE